MVFLFFNRSTRSRKQKARHATEEHRRQLQALLLNKNPRRTSVNGINNDEDLHDDGTELLGSFDIIRVLNFSSLHNLKQHFVTTGMFILSFCVVAWCVFLLFPENVDELESEGVSNLHSTGSRLSKVTDWRLLLLSTTQHVYEIKCTWKIKLWTLILSHLINIVKILFLPTILMPARNWVERCWE